MQLKIEYVPKSELKPYEGNAKLHPAEQVDQIIRSIEQFGFNDPLAVWKDNVVIEGHGRLLAAMEMDSIDTVPVIRLDNLTDEQRRAYTLVHNKLTMNSDFDMSLLELELEQIDMDMEQFGFEEKELSFGYGEVGDHGGNLAKKFVVPPFSVLDTRQGYWQDRRKEWESITGNLSETRNGEYGRLSGGIMDAINEGTSNFDPVLAEVMFKWFCVPGGKILDPFGGEQTKGVVAGECGYEYHGCEIRQEQVALNREQVSKYRNVNYYCGDSNNISEIITERGFDMCFTSPPYYDLEVYSKADMSALGTYEEFMEQYRNIFQQCYDMMCDGSFAVLKVAEIRNKKTGANRCFVADNVKLMCDIGFTFYNDIVLVNTVGTGAIRANKQMATRKVVKVHQNVLVFYKGNLKDISSKYPELTFEDIEDAD